MDPKPKFKFPTDLLTEDRQEELIARIEDAVDFREEGGKTTWTCDNKMTNTKKILKSMGFKKAKADEVVEYLGTMGGYCDCEVLFNAVAEENE